MSSELPDVSPAEVIRVADGIRLSDWKSLRYGLEFCRDLATCLHQECILRSATRIINGHTERRDYYHAWVPDGITTNLKQSIVTTTAMLENKGPYKSLMVSDLWEQLRLLSLNVRPLHVRRSYIVDIETPWRWRDFSGKDELPDETILEALKAIIETEDYKFAEQFVHQHVRTNAWKGVVRLPVPS
jgi:hypothetical protein